MRWIGNRPVMPGVRLVPVARFWLGRMRVFWHAPRSNVPMYALYRFKGERHPKVNQ